MAELLEVLLFLIFTVPMLMGLDYLLDNQKSVMLISLVIIPPMFLLFKIYQEVAF